MHREAIKVHYVLIIKQRISDQAKEGIFALIEHSSKINVHLIDTLFHNIVYNTTLQNPCLQI